MLTDGPNRSVLNILANFIMVGGSSFGYQILDLINILKYANLPFDSIVFFVCLEMFSLFNFFQMSRGRKHVLSVPLHGILEVVM